MSWCSLRFAVTGTDAEALSLLLEEAGAVSVTLKSAGERPLFDEPNEDAGLWQEVELTALFPDDIEFQSLLARLESDWQGTLPPYSTALLHDQDWLLAWREHSQPIRFGDGLWICPSWTDAPEPEALNLYIDPGMAFGTGSHETTLMCLEWLGQQRQSLSGKRILDYGCGSGILAIAAHRLGASEVCGVDIDPQALPVARQNASDNNSAKVVFAGVDADLQAADILLANILARPLVQLADTLTALVNSGGELVLSGLLSAQVDEVTAAYDDAFTFMTPRLRNDWVLLHALKKA